MSDDNDEIARLLRMAGRRPEPAPEAMQRMHASVHAAWRSRQRARTSRRVFAIAASVLLAATAGTLAWQRLATPAAAMVARVVAPSTSLQIDRAGLDRLHSLDPQVVHVGDRISTGSAGGTTLAHLPGGGTTLRLDRDTVVAWTAGDELEVVRGSVYVDTGLADRGAAPLTLLAGSLRIAHVGTQFMTQVTPQRVRVTVRDGRVRVTRGADSSLAGRGEQIEAPADGSGTMRRARVSPSGDGWDWVDVLAPATPVEGRTLAQVLEMLAYQAGLELSFESPAVAGQAAAVVLHGPALALPPRDAIATVLATTRFRSQEPAAAETGELRIVLGAE